ncbi:hypothetical protein PV726_46310 [Streptomyces europaeiscabiei]|uniref:alcohol dehydrogenase catalytic domain-containing protein n=1 Tax=Streptomyces europaeiscabiei TaxID=146819 RepID=UPI0029BE82D7|nr:hypothetical protein [Streptomyces europaeiscabiei]MDX3697486.1 hypothetical protein [Streptomyces europaeiscabiei]
MPGDNEVLIKVEAVSIEGGDLLNRPPIPLPRSPHVVGYGSAGTVVAAGVAAEATNRARVRRDAATGELLVRQPPAG